MQSKEETKPGSGKYKTFKAIRVQWGEGFEQMHPDDEPIHLDTEEGDDDVAAEVVEGMLERE